MYIVSNITRMEKRECNCLYTQNCSRKIHEEPVTRAAAAKGSTWLGVWKGKISLNTFLPFGRYTIYYLVLKISKLFIIVKHLSKWMAQTRQPGEERVWKRWGRETLLFGNEKIPEGRNGGSWVQRRVHVVREAWSPASSLALPTYSLSFLTQVTTCPTRFSTVIGEYFRGAKMLPKHQILLISCLTHTVSPWLWPLFWWHCQWCWDRPQFH